MPVRTRIAIIVTVFMMGLAAYGTWIWRSASGNLGDLIFPICAARNGFAPDVYYGLCEVGVDAQGQRYALYPLTTAFVLLPLSILPNYLVTLVFMSVSIGLLAWGVMRAGEPWRLLIFISAPLWLSIHWTQWPPLMVAAWYLPWLWPIALLAKPHTALPVALLRWQQWPWGIAIVAGIGLLSLAFNPRWPLDFLGSIGGYSGGPAMLNWYGPPLLLALLRWRDERARLLLFASLVPLRGLYDLLLLFVIPNHRWSMVVMVIVSWAAFNINGGGDVSGPGLALMWLTALLSVMVPHPVTVPSPATVPSPIQREEQADRQST